MLCCVITLESPAEESSLSAAPVALGEGFEINLTEHQAFLLHCISGLNCFISSVCVRQLVLFVTAGFRATPQL